MSSTPYSSLDWLEAYEGLVILQSMLACYINEYDAANPGTLDLLSAVTSRFLC